MTTTRAQLVSLIQAGQPFRIDFGEGSSLTYNGRETLTLDVTRPGGSRATTHATTRPDITAQILDAYEVEAGITPPARLDRRDFLKQSARAILAGTAAAGFSLPALAQALESTPDSDIQAQLPPYGPADRTALIDHCAARLDVAIVSLEKMWSFLIAARSLAPTQVDGNALFTLEEQARSAMDTLDHEMESAEFDDLFGAATGKRGYYWCLSREIIQSEKLDRPLIQGEVSAFREDYPGQAGELQAMLDARYEGVL